MMRFRIPRYESTPLPATLHLRDLGGILAADILSLNGLAYKL